MVLSKIAKIPHSTIPETIENQLSYQHKSGEKMRLIFCSVFQFMMYLPEHPSG